VISEFIVFVAISAAVALAPVIWATCASKTRYLNESTSNAARTYIFLIKRGGANFSLNSYAIYAKIVAD
jgi:hypothetical protein